MFFDTHAHYDDVAFDDDLEQTFRSIRSAGVEFVLDPGCNLKSTLKAEKLANTYPFVYFAAGVHPSDAEDLPLDYLDTIERAASNPKCLAIGEIGLDYYWEPVHKEAQKIAFTSQLELAMDLKKPVIIHDREAHGDSLAMIKAYNGIQGVFHCFSGSREMAEELLKLGFYLGFDGPITYKNNKKAEEILTICPLDRILIETDSPYLSPVPNRGKRNDSSNLLYIAQRIAEIKGISLQEIGDITTYNAKNCFHLI